MKHTHKYKIIKRYLWNLGGSSPEYWDNTWRRSPQDLEELVLQADLRLVRKLEQYLQPGSRILEGGCGSGVYVAYFLKQGYQVIGIDFAEKTVERLKGVFPNTDVRVGDIKDLPFNNDSFDAYYSGGVIEHFEEGVESQLKEAFRVLRPGGMFFVTVPYINTMRNLASFLFADRIKIDLDGQTTFLRVAMDEFKKEPTPESGFVFHEYVLSSGIMRNNLIRKGFIIEAEMPFSARWGLLDIAPYRRLAGIDLLQRHIVHKLAALPLRLISLIEQHRKPLIEIIASSLGVMLGNLKLFVARKP